MLEKIRLSLSQREYALLMQHFSRQFFYFHFLCSELTFTVLHKVCTLLDPSPIISIVYRPHMRHFF